MKKLVSVLLVMALAIAVLPAMANEVNVAEEVLLKIKEKIDVPEDLEEFHYSENKYDNVLRYDFTWNNEDYSKEIYVSADSRGRIVSYSYYERTDYSADRTLIGYTLSDAQPLAEKTARRMFGEYFAEGATDALVLNEEKTTASYSGRYKSFSFTFERICNTLPVESNRVTVRVRATKDKMYVQSVNASLDEDAGFGVNNTEFKDMTKREKYEEKFPIRLYYAKDYSEEDGKAKLFYAINKGYVAYGLEEVITEVRFDRYASVTEDSAADMEAGGTLFSKNEAAITPKEQGEIDKMTSLVKPEEIQKKLTDIALLKITDDMLLTETFTYKSDEKYFVSITLEGEERYLSATYNGETGEVTNIHSYFTKYDEPEEFEEGTEYAVPEDEIKSFAALLAGEKMNEAKTEFSNQNNRSVMNAERIVNGVPYPENRISVTYDAVNAVVTRYAIYWDEDVSMFPMPEEAIVLEDAREIIFELAGLKDVYVKQEKEYVAAVTIGKGVTINAVTGSEMYTPVKNKQAYADIENHWAEDIINILWEHDVYLEGDKFNPDGAINQADMIVLFSACRDSGVIPIGWTKEQIAVYGVDNGFVKAKEPDKIMTRHEGFKAMANVLGYGDVAEFDIYKTSYADMEPCGSAEILKAMGVLVGDIARPDDVLTRAEAAVMVYRYLSR